MTQKLKLNFSKKIHENIWDRISSEIILNQFLPYQVKYRISPQWSSSGVDWKDSLNKEFDDWLDSHLEEPFYEDIGNGILYMSSKEDYVRFRLKWESNESKW